MLKNRRVIAIIFTLLFLLPIFGFGEEDTAAEFDAELDTEFDIEELRQRVLQEAPNELFSMSLFDNDVSLFFSGSWFGSFQLNPGFSFSPIGSGFMPPQTPVFSQEVDLTLSLWINNRWFVEANFNDGHAQNTYSAGYQGMPGEFIQFAVIGNTGLDFPSFPYMDLGGDSAASFGFYSRMGNQTWDIHTLLRYDSSAREERVFYGGRERNFFYEQPQNSIRGVSFVLPDYNIDSPIVVYIEDDRGTIIDNSFRRWRVASPSEFAASSSQGLVELSFRPQGMVAVSYSKNGDTRAWDISMGNYDGVPDGYLRTVQEWFGSGINLGDFPQAGNRNPAARRPGEVEFGTVPALVVFEPGTFSPFERRNRYQSPSSASEMSALVRLSSGSEISGFELIPFDSSFFTTDLLVFTAAAGQINIYELLKIGNFSRRDPQTLWPLAYDSPEIYLDVSNVFPGDIALRFTNFNAAGGFFIGTDIVPGSVQVWRSGIQDTNFSYSSFTGEVTLLGSVGQNELIRITFLRRSEETRLGSIAAGIGAIYQGAGPFSAQAAIGARMNVTSDTYSDEEHSSAGTLGLSAAADWDWDNLNFRVTGGMFFEQADQAGLFRIAGMEGHELLLPLPPQNAFISNPPISNPPSVNFTNLNPDNRSDLIFRNYINRTVLGNNLMPIEWNTPIIAGVNRPYPARDTQLGNAQVLALEFDFSGAENWSGFQVPISQFAPNLSGAGEIEIPFRFFGFNRELQPLDNFKVIIQIGALSGSDFAFVENQQLIWEKVLFDTDQDTFSNAGRIIRFTLDEDDRQKLSGARYIRLLAVYEGTETLTGRVLLASPIVRGAAFRPVISDGDAVIGTNIGVTAIETIDTHHPTLADAFPEIIRRVSSTPYTQRVLRVNWENLNTGFSAGVDSRLGNIPLADYRELAFFVKIPNGAFGNQNETLTFKIAAGPDNLDDYRLRANIPLDSLAARAGEWNKITIRYQGSNTGVFLNDGNVSVSDVFYRPNRGTGDNFSRNTNYTIILINPVNSVTALGDGTIYIDEIILEDPITFYRINAGAVLDYSRPGVLLSAGRTAILSDFTFFSAFESEIRSSMNTDDSIMFGSMAGRTGIDFSFLGTQISANLNSTIAQDTFLWSAEHEIS
ncbi:MAG: hypothetical protein FWC97_04390, partial [Treponema sp.]|nr:hypothetical protein [Treponema sp.]